MSNLQILANVLTALIAFFGAIGGVILGRHLQTKFWEKEFNVTLRKDIFEQRIKLIERMAYLLHKSERVQVIKDIIDAQVYVIKMAIKNNDRKLPEGWFDKGINMDSLLELNKEMLDITAEFAAVGSLSLIYFGKKTKLTIGKISKLERWFSLSIQDRQSILDSMAEELNEF